MIATVERTLDALLHSSHLLLHGVLQSHVVILDTNRETDLMPEEAKVAVALHLGRLVEDLSPLAERLEVDKTRGLLADDGNVPLEDVKRDSWLRADRQLVGPEIGESGLVELSLLHLVHASDEGDVVLLQNTEAGAEHGRVDQTLEETLVKSDVAVAIITLDAVLE